MFCRCVRWLRLGWPARGPWFERRCRLRTMTSVMTTTTTVRRQDVATRRQCRVSELLAVRSTWIVALHYDRVTTRARVSIRRRTATRAGVHQVCLLT